MEQTSLMKLLLLKALTHAPRGPTDPGGGCDLHGQGGRAGGGEACEVQITGCEGGTKVSCTIQGKEPILGNNCKWSNFFLILKKKTIYPYLQITVQQCFSIVFFKNTFGFFCFLKFLL